MSPFAAELAPLHLAPLWERLSALVTPEPHPGAAPATWHYADMRAALMRAGELVTAEEAERRVLILENPALVGQSAITPWLYAGLQLVLPGETAPPHRHTQSALRFVIEGHGGHTSVDGERATMAPGDLILTPNWMWHAHGGGDGPTIWLDGLDIPAVRLLGASFAEKPGATPLPAGRPEGDASLRYGAGLLPVGHRAGGPASPLFHYPYARARAVLDALARADAPDPHYAHAAEYRNPVTGGPALPTIGCRLTLVPAGFATRPLRRTGGDVTMVVEGALTLHRDNEPTHLERGDVAVVPAWCAARLRADAGPAVVFTMSAEPVLRALGLFREARC